MLLDVLARNMDLVIAGALIAVGLVALVLSRMKFLPAKAMPFVIGAIAGVVGITVLNRARARQLKKQVAELEQRIAQRQKEIDEASKDLERRDELLKQAQKEYEASLKNYKKNVVKYVKPKQDVENMSDEDIFKTFDGIGN